ncbi:MAG: hypothetical protein D3924_09585 [Candidatus Electrothrix sp. AR4]|nr:hypothetical protein [Candidatus Electrothrix sp. AR4]
MEGLLASGMSVPLLLQLRYSMQIAKLPLCLLVSFSSLFGFLYAAEAFSFQALLVFFAILFLSSGAASMNSYQERVQDALMRRTRNRPLVQKRLREKTAFLQAVVLLGAGLCMLLLFADYKAFLTGILAVVLYNYVYTQLKALTPYALLPGAICGALPPYIGWLAGGGEVFSLRAALPVLLLFFWQIPHFFLVLLKHKEDYLSTRLPNLLRSLSEPTLRRLLLPWIGALSVTLQAFTVFPMHSSLISRSLLSINALVLFGVFAVQLVGTAQEPNYRYLFRHLNCALFFMMLVVVLQ